MPLKFIDCATITVGICIISSWIYNYYSNMPHHYIKIIKSDTKFDDIIGCDKIKKKMKLCFKLLEQTSIDDIDILPKGYLFKGVPGTGKTCMVRAIANQANVPLVVINWHEIYNLQRKQNILNYVYKNYAPCIIFIDEFYNHSGIVHNQLLELLDGINKMNKRIIIIGATTEQDINESITRSGRLSVIDFDKPSYNDRMLLFKTYLTPYELKDINYENITFATTNTTQSDIQDICICAKRISLEDDRNYITQTDLCEAIHNNKVGENNTTTIASLKSDILLTCHHEAAHFLILYILKSYVKPNSLSVEMHQYFNGVTTSSSDSNTYLISDILKLMTVDCASIVGEQLYCFEYSTGCSNDIDKFDQKYDTLQHIKHIDCMTINGIRFGELSDNIDENKNKKCKDLLFAKCLSNVRQLLHQYADDYNKLINKLYDHHTLYLNDIEQIINPAIKNTYDVNILTNELVLI